MPTIRSILQKLEINTAETILDECNDLSTRGKVYEGLWDIAFKFNCVIPKAVHYTTHQNKVGLYKLKDYKRKFLDCEVGTNISGWSDITFKLNEQIYMTTCKYIEPKSIDKWDICKVKDALVRNGCIDPNVLVLTKNTEDFYNTLNRANNKDLYAPHIHKVFDLANLEVYLEQVYGAAAGQHRLDDGARDGALAAPAPACHADDVGLAHLVSCCWVRARSIVGRCGAGQVGWRGGGQHWLPALRWDSWSAWPREWNRAAAFAGCGRAHAGPHRACCWPAC